VAPNAGNVPSDELAGDSLQLGPIAAHPSQNGQQLPLTASNDRLLPDARGYACSDHAEGARHRLVGSVVHSRLFAIHNRYGAKVY
jgi:hypothetical protein